MRLHKQLERKFKTGAGVLKEHVKRLQKMGEPDTEIVRLAEAAQVYATANGGNFITVFSLYVSIAAPKAKPKK